MNFFENLIIWFTVILVVGVFGLVLFPVSYSTTRGGSHTGYITAVEQEGLFFHTYNVYFKTDSSSSQEDVYCIREASTGLAQMAKEAQRSNQKVTVVYDGERGFGYHLCDYDRIDVIEIKN